MKRLTCEMCGSTNLIKQNGVFFCQDCGTKYSVEDAKKMMIEEAELSTSTDKVDTVNSIESYYKMAESAYASNNREEAEKNCDKIIEIDPDNYKAWLLKGQAVGWQTTLANIRLEEAVNCFFKAVDKASEEERVSVEKKTSSEFLGISYALVELCCENYAKNPSVQNADKIINVFGIITNSVHVMDEFAAVFNRAALMPVLVTHVIATTIAGYELRIREDYWEAPNYPSNFEWEYYINRCLGALRLLNLVIKLCDTDKLVLGPEELIIKACECKIHILRELDVSVAFEHTKEGGNTKYRLDDNDKQMIANMIMECQKRIKKINPDYKIPSESKSSSKGCYVATAVYGSYDCPQVWTLRRYRDNHLALTWYGRAFIYTYYAISPTIVKWFGHTEWFKNMWRRKLDRMVKNLQDKGYESTPYQDRDWR